MAKRVLRRKALEDLENIWHYTKENWGESQADAYYRTLTEAMDFLIRFPEAGRRYEEVYPGLRGFRAGKHILFYLIRHKNTVEIIRILHERMDFRRHLGK